MPHPAPPLFRTVHRAARVVRAGALYIALGGLGAALSTLQAQGRGAPPLDISKLPTTPKVPETFEGLFEAREARARAALGYLRCMQTTVSALRGGALGQVPRDWSLTCIEQGTEWRGVFGQLTDAGIQVTLQVAYRGERTVMTTDAVDTSRVNGTARALLRGLSAPLPGRGTYEFTPVPVPQGKYMEVWFLPVPSDPTKAVVGGDSLIQMTADGTRELGHAMTTPPIRRISVPLQGTTWTLPSTEERIPAVSELLVARLATDLIPEVRIQTRQYVSTTRRGQRTWTHTPR